MDGFVTLEDLEVELAAVEHRAGGKSPLKGKVAVIFGDASGPQFLSRMVKGGQGAIAEKEKGSILVRHRRRGGEIALFIALNAFPDFVIPQEFASLAIEAQGVERLIGGVGGGNKNALA